MQGRSDSPQSKIAREFLKTIDPKDFFNNGGWKSGAANYLHRRYTDLWPTKESARNTIRYLTDSLAHKKGIKHKYEFFNIDIDTKEDLGWQTPCIIPSGRSRNRTTKTRRHRLGRMDAFVRLSRFIRRMEGTIPGLR